MSPAKRQFALMLRELRERVKDVSVEELAGRIHVRRSSLSGYLLANRLPDLEIARSLYDEVHKQVALESGSMPFSREQLESAHRAAQVRLCNSCPARTAGSVQCSEGAPAGSPKPAAADSRGEGEPQIDPSIGAVVAQDNLPVPYPEGDRQPDAAVPWAATSELLGQLEGGRAGDARIILLHVGTRLAIEEIPAAVDSCRAVGLNDAANAILNYAASRASKDVLHLARLLVSAGRQSDAETLLKAAATD
ncbi:helix-turn-helix domain-containing protein [Microbispora amethystogenes]|uniref:helix-turn-helix domain-containing protein n=1 Tax=Microbispora amethystogenes TaxID=1427754 RepID=UPI0019547411|nr:helix-turn-helix transcriptional regulator [Microbispora amethystogenes]